MDDFVGKLFCLSSGNVTISVEYSVASSAEDDVTKSSGLGVEFVYRFEYGETHLQNLLKRRKSMKETFFRNGRPGRTSCRRRPLV